MDGDGAGSQSLAVIVVTLLFLSLSPLDHENFRVRLRGKTTRNSFFFRENFW